jgi:hypothetical protein
MRALLVMQQFQRISSAIPILVCALNLCWSLDKDWRKFGTGAGLELRKSIIYKDKMGAQFQ